MSQKSGSHDDQAVLEQELVESVDRCMAALFRSGLSDGDKLFYLYLFLKGEISVDLMQQMSKDMEEVSKAQERSIAQKKQEIAELEARIAALDQHLDEVADRHASDLKHDTEQLLHKAAEHAESSQKAAHKSSIKQLKKRLQH